MITEKQNTAEEKMSINKYSYSSSSRASSDDELGKKSPLMNSRIMKYHYYTGGDSGNNSIQNSAYKNNNDNLLHSMNKSNNSNIINSMNKSNYENLNK